MKTRQVLSGLAVAFLAWVAAANTNRVQAKYESDIVDYEASLAVDPLPVKAPAQLMQKEMAPISFDVFNRKQPTFFDTSMAEAPDQMKETGNANALCADGLINTAFKFLGTRYRSGMSGPGGFDCSGFTSYVYGLHDIHLTHNSSAQYNEGTHVNDVAQLQKGDLVFFGGTRGSSRSISHVGIVTEVDPGSRSFKFIHASVSSGIKVDSSRDAYYSRRYVGACRVMQ